MAGVPLRVHTFDAYRQVFRALEGRGIRYTLLKGTSKLEEALAGVGDVDLLVDPTSLADSVVVLLDSGFKPARSLIFGDEPAQQHYFAPDRSGGWAHVHLHSAVVCSEQLRTELLLSSMTEPYLARSEEIDGIRLPDGAAEYAHLLLKVFIRFASVPDLLLAATRRWRPWAEIEAVRSRATIDAAGAVLEESGLDIPEALLTRCDLVLAEGRIGPQAIWLGWRIRRQLGGHRVDSRVGRWRDYLRILTDKVRRASTGGGSRGSDFGGAIVAIVGPDAVGKSTLVAGLSSRFGAHFRVGVYHGGKPRSTVKTLPLRLARMVRRQLKGGRSVEGEGSTSPDSRPSLSRAVNAWALAEDRRSTVVRAQRSASRGNLVLFDRYPSQTSGGMDGPRLEKLKSSRGLSGRLSRKESSTYEALTPPDLVIRLTAPVSALVERDLGRGDPDGAAYLHQRSAPEVGWGMSGFCREVEIATEVGVEELRERAVGEIWRVF